MLFYDDNDRSVRKIKVGLLRFSASLDTVQQIGDYLLFTKYPDFFTISTISSITEDKFEDTKLQSLFSNEDSDISVKNANCYLFGIE